VPSVPLVPPVVPATTALAPVVNPPVLPPPTMGSARVQQVQAVQTTIPAPVLPAETIIVTPPASPLVKTAASTPAPLPAAPIKSVEITSQRIPPGTLPPQLVDPASPLKPAVDPGLKTAALHNRETMPTQRQFISTTRLFLDYRLESLGASGVGKVEVWCTRDLGQTWHRLCEDTDRQSPAEVVLPGEGVFGLSLVVSNGRGFGATPPNSGDSPDYWIEVDATKPAADLVQIRTGTGDDSGAVHIAWSARDKNLSAESIELQFAAGREGPWQPIAKGLKSEGIYRWVPPAEAGTHAFVRLSVRDQAGNVATADTEQAVALDDMSRPRGRVTGITTTAPRSGTPTLP
jgi:hypothetical protein